MKPLPPCACEAFCLHPRHPELARLSACAPAIPSSRRPSTYVRAIPSGAWQTLQRWWPGFMVGASVRRRTRKRIARLPPTTCKLELAACLRLSPTPRSPPVHSSPPQLPLDGRLLLQTGSSVGDTHGTDSHLPLFTQGKEYFASRKWTPLLESVSSHAHPFIPISVALFSSLSWPKAILFLSNPHLNGLSTGRSRN